MENKMDELYQIYFILYFFIIIYINRKIFKTKA